MNMTRENYTLFENFMLCCMKDTAHDKHHIYRVLYIALDIAEHEKYVNYEVLICACLLHDIGRQEEYDSPEVCHAVAGGEKAYRFLIENGFDTQYSKRVQQCIETHRYRAAKPPFDTESQILFDADKIDVTGAIGIARTILYGGHTMEPLYTLNHDGSVSDGIEAKHVSFFQEYKFKLESLYSKLYTKRGTEIALERQKAAVDFYNSMLKEVKSSYESGMKYLDTHIEGN